MNIKKIGNKIATGWKLVGLGIFVGIWCFLVDDNRPPFLSVAIEGTETAIQYQISVCNEVSPIKQGEILSFYDHCEGTVFLMDNLSTRLSEGVYISGSFRSVVIFRNMKNKSFSALAVYDHKYN